MLADQELDDGRVAVASSAIKGCVPMAVGDGQQAPLPRVKLGLRDHQLDEFQWRPGTTGDRDGSDAIAPVEDAMVEDLIDRVAVCEGMDMGDSPLPLLACHGPVKGVHRPAGAARVSVRSGEGEFEERRG